MTIWWLNCEDVMTNNTKITLKWYEICVHMFQLNYVNIVETFFHFFALDHVICFLFLKFTAIKLGTSYWMTILSVDISLKDKIAP